MRVRRILKLLPLMIPCVLALSVWMPMLMIVGGSFMGTQEVVESLAPVLSGEKGFASWHMLPEFPTVRPYIELLLDSPQFFVMFWNSIKIVVLILVGQLLFGAPAAWGFSRCKGKIGNVLFTVYIVLMLMPFQVTMVSSYLVLDQTKLLDTHWALILPAVFSTFPVFIMYRFFCGISQEIIEAAALDGANDFKVFFFIGAPLGASGIMSAVVLGFLEYWNMIEQPLTFLHDKTLWPLSLYLPDIATDKAGLALAASVVTLMPAILVFMLGQKYLEAGIKAAGLKE